MRRLFWSIISAIGLALFAGALWLSYLWFVPVGPSGTVPLTVYRGDRFLQVVTALQQQGLLRSRFWFEQFARWHGWPDRLQAGIYRIPTPISLWRLARWFSQAKPELIPLVVWEGMMAKEIAERVEKLGLGRAERFLHIVRQPQGQVTLPFEWQGDLEGLLFPATYLVPPLREGEEAYLVQLMVDNFVKRFWQPYREEIERSPFSLRELVTLASLVQWEVKMDDERPIVAGVILNRLKKGMKLEIDATVLHALGVRKRRVLFRALQVDSPYNTYRYKGLPPGAICSPGLPSLLAALRPAKVPYLYYVARGDGYHTFSRTYEEHLKGVAAYRAWQRQQGLR